ncbi:BMP family ABC transporter substrate-binding protein [Azohydromonas caseinilytica]|uniref:BMP family ABC transporter substrate-binding protein n=1 Tax=Azohydromonas caseinilytica TaxID=2728836 RepID=A0A848F7Z1_9BURK|nr:BMP family ABC transporter substrate-binding protein [Azohydromonas caseinilytica]NML14835.1 BMP family ABC transporter substrate-binding protein [Azohydromonas caseinilytica]
MFKNLWRGALLAACVAASPAFAQTSKPFAAPLKAAFVYVTPVGQAGWTFQHEQGRLAMEKALGAAVKSTVVEAVPEGPDSERVMRDLAAQGHQLIFATSFGYLEPALRVAGEFPNVKFEHVGGYKTAANLGTYNARFYEGRWLAGYLAGKVSKSGTAGYVAGFPLPEVIQGINAFALGMQAANPKAQVKVMWLNTWFDPAKEREAALSLVNAGADVLTPHSASPAVPQAAEEKGVHLLAFHSDMSRFAPHAQLAAVVANWGGYYTQVAKAVMAQRWQPTPVWGGIKDGMVELAALNPALPKALRDEVQARQRAIAQGKLIPFGGRLVDQDGRVRQDKGALDDAAIARMDWFVQGVQGTLPSAAK